MKKLLFAIAAAFTLLSCSQPAEQTADYRIVPLPHIELTDDAPPFRLRKTTSIVCESDSLMREAEFLRDYIKELTGLKLDIKKHAEKNYIELGAYLGGSNLEAYEIKVTKSRILINGVTAAGTFYGIQALRKSIPAKVIPSTVVFPAGKICAAPLFSYRGTLLDVGRHPMEVDSVEAFIDMLALHNINTLHLHLTEDQGWRIEIKKYPKLTEIGSTRPGTMVGRNFNEYDSVPVSGYYTQEQARHLVDYAAERHITIIPEIDLPGHMLAALASYPELGCKGSDYEVWKRWGISDDILCAGNPATYQFLDDVLTEIIDIFPSEYIHLGGDEAPKARWRECPKCQAKIAELGLKSDEHSSAEAKLQTYVMAQAQETLKRHGRKMIGWDEILEGGAPDDAVVMSWRGTDAAVQAAKSGHDAVLTPTQYLYFDYCQTLDSDTEPVGIGGYLPVERVYSFEPISPELTPDEAKHIIGVQANLWREYIKTLSHSQYMVLPRLAALSEVQWVEPTDKDYGDFLDRLQNMISHYDAYGYTYARHIYNVAGELKSNPETKSISVTLSTMGDQPIHYTTDGTDPTSESPLYRGTLEINEPCQVRAVAVAPDGKLSQVYTADIALSKSAFKNYTLKNQPHRNYPGRDGGLTDGVLGKKTFRMPEWTGFQAADLVATIDMEEPTEVSSVAMRFFVDTSSWIYDARAIKVETSMDGTTFKTVASVDYPQAEKHNWEIAERQVTFAPVEARYVRVTVVPEHSIPAWHTPAAGGTAFVFTDEICIN